MTAWLFPRKEVLLGVAGERGGLLDLAEGGRLAFAAAEAPALLAWCRDGAPAPAWLDALTPLAPALSRLAASAPPRACLPLAGPADLLRLGGWEQLFLELTDRCTLCCFHCSCEAGPGAGHTLPREAAVALPGGRAAVLADGRIVPCIFLRELLLGHLRGPGDLAAALEAPPATLAVAVALAGERDGAGLWRRLACPECRFTKLLCAPLREGGGEPPR
jgi:hypothetical protein